MDRYEGYGTSVLKFEEFELDPQERELRKTGEIRAVEPQVFDLLHFMVANPGKLLTKDDINAQVWNGRIVSEAALSSRISAARDAIDDDGKTQRLIKTVYGKGFRFVGDVLDHQERTPGQATVSSIQLNSLESLKHSIAVLPFDNMSTNQDQEFLADGLCEDIITTLSKVGGLSVTARNSSFIYKGRPVDITQVGKEQNVRYVLEGSTRKSGDRVRINAQLIDASTGKHLWAHRYDREYSEVFELQDDITREIVTALQIEIIDGERARVWAENASSFQAWELTRKANRLISSYTPSKVLEGRELACQALKLDGNYSAAQVVYAHSYFPELYDGWTADIPGSVSKGMTLLKTVLNANPEEPHALAILGMFYLYSGDHDRSREMLTKAGHIAPSDYLVLNFLAAEAMYSGRFEEAEQACLSALRVSPMYPGTVLGMMANLYIFIGQYDVAADWANRSITRAKNYIFGPAALTAAEYLRGDLESAKRASEQVLAIDRKFSARRYCYAKPFKDRNIVDPMFNALLASGLSE